MVGAYHQEKITIEDIQYERCCNYCDRSFVTHSPYIRTCTKCTFNLSKGYSFEQDEIAERRREGKRRRQSPFNLSWKCFYNNAKNSGNANVNRYMGSEWEW